MSSGTNRQPSETSSLERVSPHIHEKVSSVFGAPTHREAGKDFFSLKTGPLYRSSGRAPFYASYVDVGFIFIRLRQRSSFFLWKAPVSSLLAFTLLQYRSLLPLRRVAVGVTLVPNGIFFRFFFSFMVGPFSFFYVFEPLKYIFVSRSGFGPSR